MENRPLRPFELVKDAFLSIFGNVKNYNQILLIALVLIFPAILVFFSFSRAFSFEEAGGEPTAFDLILAAFSVLFMIWLVLVMSVAWHRYIFLGEKFSYNPTKWFRAEIVAYFTKTLLLTIILLLPIILFLPILMKISMGGGDFSTFSALAIVFLISFFITPFFYTFAPVLVQTALGEKVSLFSAWPRMKTYFGGLIGVFLYQILFQIIAGLLITLILLVSSKIHPGFGLFVEIIAIILVRIPLGFLPLSIMNEIYRRLYVNDQPSS